MKAEPCEYVIELINDLKLMQKVENNNLPTGIVLSQSPNLIVIIFESKIIYALSICRSIKVLLHLRPSDSFQKQSVLINHFLSPSAMRSSRFAVLVWLALNLLS